VSEDRPTGAELLAEARRTLLEELIGLLPADRRYDGLMVANAMAIAARELAAADAPARAALAGSRRSTARRRRAGRRRGRARLSRFNRRLAADIRAGAFDAAGARRDAIVAHLRAVTLARLRLSNPKALQGDTRA
jgi:hypothetical protein